MLIIICRIKILLVLIFERSNGPPNLDLSIHMNPIQFQCHLEAQFCHQYDVVPLPHKVENLAQSFSSQFCNLLVKCLFHRSSKVKNEF